MNFNQPAKLLVPILGVVAVLSLTPIFGQGTRAAMVADVPFDFIVRNATFPDGEYNVCLRILSSGQVLFLKGEGHSVLALARHADNINNGPSNEAKLVFNRYGEDRYFLSEIWMPGVEPQQLPKCSSEREQVTSSWKLQRITINLRPTDKPIKSGK
jgi:hypothetical protein